MKLFLRPHPSEASCLFLSISWATWYPCNKFPLLLTLSRIYCLQPKFFLPHVGLILPFTGASMSVLERAMTNILRWKTLKAGWWWFQCISSVFLPSFLSEVGFHIERQWWRLRGPELACLIYGLQKVLFSNKYWTIKKKWFIYGWHGILPNARSKIF